MTYQTSRIFLIAAAFGLSAGAAQAGPLITGNQSINSSLCVGTDCAASETYGSDTIRLKENNLRIHFDDTSVAGSFPNQDWRIEVNAQANGGAEYFRVIDATASRNIFTLEANAPNNSLVVDNGGRIGNGTANPAVEIHTANGDSPTLRLEQNGSSGFAPQTWDVAGNETNFFIRDVTNGSQLPFRIQPGADTNAIYIANNNEIGMGTNAPGADLHVRAGGTAFSADASTVALFQNNAAVGDVARVSILSGNTGNGQIGFGDVDNEFAGRIRYFHTENEMDFIIDGSIEVLSMHSSGPNTLTTATSAAVLTSAGVWQDASSRTLKQNIRSMDLTDAKSALRDLEPVTYQYKKEPGELVAGFVAEDVPDMVATSSRKTLSALDITAVLTKVVQDQQDTIDEQRAMMARMEARIDALEK